MFFINSCALIVNGTSQDIPVNSYPINADIYVNNKRVAQTPSVIELPRSENNTVMIVKNGYETASFVFAKKTSMWYWMGWIFFTGPLELFSLIGGSLNRLEPNEIYIMLEEKR